MEVLGSALVSGALASCQKLCLDSNQIGDVGLSALAGLRQRGLALTFLTSTTTRSGPDEALADALPGGAGPVAGVLAPQCLVTMP